MKRKVQLPGVAKWYGDDWTTIQDELLSVVEGHFGSYGQQFILTGCAVIGNAIGAGIVGLNHADGFRLCRFAGVTGAIFPLYLKAVKTEETRLYQDGAVKPVAEIYTAELSATNDGGYLQLLEANTTARYTDVIQNANHRFVTDTEKANYAGQASAAIATLRDGIANELNTLEKLRASVQLAFDNLPETVGVDTIYATLRGGVDAAYDTMQKIIGYVQGLTYLPTFQGTSDLATNVIDWTGTPERTKTLIAAVELDASNLVVGKTIGLIVTGAFALTFNSKFERLPGSPMPVSGQKNYVQMKCINNAVGFEKIIWSSTQLQL